MTTAGALMRVSWECVHFSFSPQNGMSGVRSELADNGIAIFSLDGSSVRSKDELLAQVANALAFPNWSGMNWDALLDSLRDLSWLPAHGYVLIVQSAQDLWQQAYGIAGIFTEIWLAAAEYWSQHDTPFHLVFVG